MPTLPNMNLVLPIEGGSNDQWAVLLDAIFALIDAHDHGTGKGVPVPSTSLSIVGDVPMATHAFTGLSAVSFTEIAAAAAASYVGLFINSSDHNLYFRNGNGTNVQLTSGATLNVSIVGGIGGDYSSVNALLSYVDADLDYLLQQEGSPRPWAGLRTGDIKLYQKAVGIANYIALISPNALAASYTMTMPAALPASQVLMQMTAAGVLTPSNTLPVDASITLSGKGTIATGQKQIAIPIEKNDVIGLSGGSVSAVLGTGGCVQSSPTITAYYRLPPLTFEQRLLSLIVFASDAGTNATYSIVQYNESAPAYAAVAGASRSGAGTITPTTPVRAGGAVYVLKVVTGSGDTTINNAYLNYDVQPVP